jgi:predicted HTH transcriptional regulator
MRKKNTNKDTKIQMDEWLKEVFLSPIPENAFTLKHVRGLTGDDYSMARRKIERLIAAGEIRYVGKRGNEKFYTRIEKGKKK